MISRETTKILKLIEEKKTCNEISNSMHITNLQLFKKLTNLENKGFVFERKYYSDGNIIYAPIFNPNSYIPNKYKRKESIIVEENANLKAIAISDVHLGSEKEGLVLLKKIYDYCKKNDIHIIFNCGDLIDGDFGKENKTILNTYDQINYLIENYPFDKNILNFCLTGDHDLSAFHSFQDISTIVKNYRHDLIFPGYSFAYVKIGNDNIFLNHFHRDYNSKKNKPVKNVPLILNGHYHSYHSINGSKRTIELDVPSLSTITPDLPTFLEFDFNIENSRFRYMNIKQILMKNKEYILNEMRYDLSYRACFNENAKVENITRVKEKK